MKSGVGAIKTPAAQQKLGTILDLAPNHVSAKYALDIAKIRPIARMGYFDYAVIDSVFEMIIPDEEALAGLEGRALRDGG